jgi:hypothetical protein
LEAFPLDLSDTFESGAIGFIENILNRGQRRRSGTPARQQRRDQGESHHLPPNEKARRPFSSVAGLSKPFLVSMYREVVKFSG